MLKGCPKKFYRKLLKDKWVNKITQKFSKKEQRKKANMGNYSQKKRLVST